MENKKIGWTGKSLGGYFGNLCFFKLLKIGLYPAYALLVFVAAYFQIFRSPKCAGARIFLSKVFGKKIGALSPRLYKLLFSFGVCLLDRSDYLAGNDRIKISDECGGVLRPLLERGGVVVLTAHFGAWAVSAVELEKFGREIFMPGADAENPKLRELERKERVRGKTRVSTGGAPDNIAAYGVLKRGGIVAMHADRYAGGRFAKVDFLGAPVRAPTAAYSLARAAGAPVVQTACVRESLFSYRLVPLGTIDASALSPEKCAEKFMSNLEKLAREKPYQWFNFYDFWE